jgi:hypothetical protein
MTGRKSTRTCDPLGIPIKKPDDLVVALIAHGFRDDPVAEEAVWSAAKEWVVKERVRKMLLLLDLFGISPEQPGCWLALSARLAEKHYSGFSVVERLPKRRGRPRGSGKLDRRELYFAVETLRRTRKWLDVAGACRDLARSRKSQWGNFSAETLEARYYEHVKEFQQSQREDPMISFISIAGQRARDRS